MVVTSGPTVMVQGLAGVPQMVLLLPGEVKLTALKKTFVMAVQPVKAFEPIVVTFSPIVTEGIPEQLLNVYAGMAVRLDRSTSQVILVQP